MQTVVQAALPTVGPTVRQAEGATLVLQRSRLDIFSRQPMDGAEVQLI